MIPTYGGAAVFGPFCTVVTGDAPRASDTRPYFGEGGLLSLDGGGRGRRTLVRGTLLGVGFYGLGQAMAAIRGFNDGQARDLVDSNGTVWRSVLMGPLEPVGRVVQTSDGRWASGFRVVLTHLE